MYYCQFALRIILDKALGRPANLTTTNKTRLEKRNVYYSFSSQVADVVGGIAVSWVANQDKSSFVVVTIIVSYESVGAIKIGVEPLAIPRRFVVGDFIELNGCVVTTPRPDASGSLA